MKIFLVLVLLISACAVPLDPPLCSPPPCYGTLICPDETGCGCACLPDP